VKKLSKYNIEIGGLEYTSTEFEDTIRSNPELKCSAVYYCFRCAREHRVWSRIGKEHLEDAKYVMCAGSLCNQKCPLRLKSDELVALQNDLCILYRLCRLLLKLKNNDMVFSLGHIPYGGEGVSLDDMFMVSVKIKVEEWSFVDDKVGDRELSAYERFKKLNDRDRRRVLSLFDRWGEEVDFNIFEETKDILALIKMNHIKKEGKREA